ncbi:lipoprotein [Amycolatopsis silviterrae]|uniref:Lipoprotein n=1 Tax=Amycolatopsis silviterrae TaxID=1656914 RepID=A0ABW5HGH0_9PSEU
MRKVVIAAGLVLFLSGCSAPADPPAAPAAPAASSPAPSSAPASSSSAPVAKDLTKYLPTEAQLSAARVRSQQKPLPYVVGSTTPLRVLRVCGADQPWDSAAKNGAQAGSVTDTVQIRELVAEYQGYSGEQVVSGLGKALDCGTAVVEDEELAVKTRFSVPGGDPQLGFCGQFRGTRITACALVLAHGNRVLAVTAAGWRATSAEQQAELKRLAPTFAAAFDQD